MIRTTCPGDQEAAPEDAGTNVVCRAFQTLISVLFQDEFGEELTETIDSIFEV